METVTFCSFKGGTAKTSSALHLGACIAETFQKKVLLVDLDSQANLSIGLGISPDEIDTISAVLQGKAKVEQTIRTTQTPNLSIIPANAYLDGIERSSELAGDVYSHERLRKALSKVSSEYDYCFIDTPPSLGWLTQSAYLASEHSVICAVPEAFSILALQRLREFHDQLNEHHTISVLGVILSFWNDRGAVNEEFLELIENSFPKALFGSKVRRDVSVSRAVLAGTPIFQFEPQSRAAEDFIKLSKEFLGRLPSEKKSSELAHV